MLVSAEVLEENGLIVNDDATFPVFKGEVLITTEKGEMFTLSQEVFNKKYKRVEAE
ncbi:hypothetical protein P4597_27680 [Peribacillus simplex]|uniref:hypothetical protein n=1 Tax=Peribacillus simplex TaxID=1478 RepID=UPI002E203B4D|nr:hypothetical protein [Peribacillus simplex]